MSEPTSTELPLDPTAYLTGPTGGESARTQGGTNRSGGVNLYGSNRTGGGEPVATSDPDDGRVTLTDAGAGAQDTGTGGRSGGR